MKNINIPLVSAIMQTTITNKITLSSIEKVDHAVLNNFIEGALFIVDNTDKLIGVITDGDIRKNCSIQQRNDLIV